MDIAAATWISRLDRTARPIYRALFDALAAAVREGELQPGDQLPPQRAVAERLGVDLTTVTRTYAAAREAGLLEGAVGRGTFVRARAADDEAGRVDLSMNLPPAPLGVSLAGLLTDTTAAILGRSDVATLMAYHPGAGTLGQRAAGAAWLAPYVGPVPSERVFVTQGAQAALTATLAAVCRPGDALIVEPLTYPGVQAAAALRGLRLLPCETDAHGPTPQGLERLCRTAGARIAYLVPTMQNPTATTLSETRRREIAQVARTHDLLIIEDDPYSRLLAAPPPSIAALAPEQTIHIATLSKCMSPGLRLGYLVCPPVLTTQIGEALRGVSLMPSPLIAAVVTAWIREGSANALLNGVRREAMARRALAADLLPGAAGSAESLHVWLPLSGEGAGQRLATRARNRGLALVTADAFATGETYRDGVRISLGGPTKRDVLGRALQEVAGMVGEHTPAARSRPPSGKRVG